MTTTIAITGTAGGSGKTVTAVTLGYGLAQRGYRTLIVDLGTLNYVSLSLGLEEQTAGIYELIMAQTPLAEIARRVREDVPLWVVSNGAKIRQVVGFPIHPATTRLLAACLRDVDYDVILLDCPPRDGFLLQSALVAADWVMVTVALDSRLASTLPAHLQALERWRSHPDHRLLGVVPHFWEPTDRVSGWMMDRLTSEYGDLLLPLIPRDVEASACVGDRLTLWEYAPQARALLGMEIEGQLRGGYVALLDYVVGEMKRTCEGKGGEV